MTGMGMSVVEVLPLVLLFVALVALRRAFFGVICIVVITSRAAGGVARRFRRRPAAGGRGKRWMIACALAQMADASGPTRSAAR